MRNRQPLSTRHGQSAAGIATALLAVLLMFATSIASATEYVMVTKRGVRIRTAPNTDSEIIGITRSGDVFEVYRRSPEWYAIIMFSGEDRYIHASLVRPTREPPALPPADQRKEACKEILRAQSRAYAEAQQRFSRHFDRLVDHERLLIDRYELPIFQRFGIAPAHNTRLLTECVTKRWH